MTIEEQISDIITKKMNDGTIEKIIETKLTNAIDSAVGDVFRWGEGEKLLKKKITDVMVPAIERHDFSDYTVKLDAILTEIVQNTKLVDNKHILDVFKELMIEPEIKEIKLTDIFEEYKNYVADNVDTDDLEVYTDDEPCYESVGVYFEVEREENRYFSRSYKHATVTFACEHDDKHELEYTMRLFSSSGDDKWTISGMPNVTDFNSLKNLSKFEVFMMRLNRGFTKIIIDTDGEDDEVTPTEEPEASWS